jgi:hypothetical protein
MKTAWEGRAKSRDQATFSAFLIGIRQLMTTVVFQFT